MNYAWTTGKALPEAANGQVFEQCNFTRKVPHTKIFEGVTGLVFRSCNLTNCDIPADATVEIVKHPGHIEYCGNVNPKLVERGILETCALNCSHVVGTDLIQVGGVTVETVYHYSNKVVP